MQFNKYIIFTLTSELQVTFIILTKRFIVESIGTATTFRCSSLKMTEEIFSSLYENYIFNIPRKNRQKQWIWLKLKGKRNHQKTLVKFCPSHHTCVPGKQVTSSFLRGGEAMNSTLWWECVFGLVLWLEHHQVEGIHFLSLGRVCWQLE